jgi:hypothetical protein
MYNKQLLLILPLFATAFASGMQDSAYCTPESKLLAQCRSWEVAARISSRISKKQAVADIQQAYPFEPIQFLEVDDSLRFYIKDYKRGILRKLQRYEWFCLSHVQPDIELQAK